MHVNMQRQHSQTQAVAARQGPDCDYLVHESTGKLQMGAEFDQGLLENQVLCNVHIRVIAVSMMTAGRQHAQH